MKKIFLTLVLCFSVFFLGGCQTQNTASPIVTKTGTIQVKSGDYYVFNSDDNLINITSNKYDLNNYLKKNIQISGQYSGDTLYVNDLTEIK